MKKLLTFSICLTFMSNVLPADNWQAIRTLKGHRAPITKTTFSPNGKHIITTSQDKTVRIWDASTRTCKYIFTGHSAAFNHDGTQLVMASCDNTACTRSTLTGQLLQTLKGHADSVFRAIFSPDGTQIMTTSQDTTVRIWDSSTSRCIHTFRDSCRRECFRDHSGSRVFFYTGDSALFFPDDRRIMTSGDKTIYIWDAKTGQLLHTFDGNKAALNHDGTQLAIRSCDRADYTIHIVSPLTGQLLHVLKGHTDYIQAAKFSHDGKLLATGSCDLTTRIWDTQTGSELHRLSRGPGWITEVEFNHDDTQLATGAKHTVHIWNTQTGQFLHTLTEHAAYSSLVAFSPNGELVASGLDAKHDNALCIWKNCKENARRLRPIAQKIGLGTFEHYWSLSE